MWRPQALVFDCDGLLVNSEHCWTAAEEDAFARRGMKFTPEHKAALIGYGEDEASKYFASVFNIQDGRPIYQEIVEGVRRIVRQNSTAMPGAVPLVERVAAHFPIAVVSNSPADLVEAALNAAGLSTLFPVIITRDDGVAPKPAPDPYLLACEKLGANPSRSVVFEDSMPGIRAAQAAECFAVGVPTLEDPAFSADIIIRSLSDPALNAWIDTHLPVVD